VIQEQIRRAELADAHGIAATLREAFLPFEPLYTPAGFLATVLTPEQLVARWSEGPVWVALEHAAVVGTVSAMPRPDELYVRSMAVRPSAQGSGLGCRLLDTVEEFAIEHGYRLLALSTTPFLSAAIRLYQRHGFRPAGELDLFGTPLVAMLKPLVTRPGRVPERGGAPPGPRF
jgi:ribosomal protein S18 acetylase RimI-like enzyme